MTQANFFYKARNKKTHRFKEETREREGGKEGKDGREEGRKAG